MVGDALRGLAQLSDRPVGGIAFGYVVGAGVVDQPLGQRARQQQVALGYRDEAVTQTVVPEFRTAGFTDPLVVSFQVRDMARAAGGRGKPPAVRERPAFLPPVG